MLSRRRFVGAAVGAVAAPAVLRGAWAQEFRFTFRPPLGAAARAQRNLIGTWARGIRRASDGRIAIDAVTDTEESETPADIVWKANEYADGPLLRTRVFELPGVYDGDLVATNLAMRDLFDTQLADDYDDVHVIALHIHAGHGLQMRDAPVRAPADLAGKRMRAPTPTSVWIAEALGATPVLTELADMPLALSTGLLDGCFIPWDVIPAFEVEDLTQYQIEGPNHLRFGTSTFQVSMARELWDSLPPELQAVITDNSGSEFSSQIAEAWRDAEERGIDTALDAGNELITLTDDEMRAFKAAMEPVDERWMEAATAEGIDGQALYDAAKAAIRKHSSR